MHTSFLNSFRYLIHPFILPPSKTRPYVQADAMLEISQTLKKRVYGVTHAVSICMSKVVIFDMREHHNKFECENCRVALIAKF